MNSQRYLVFAILVITTAFSTNSSYAGEKLKKSEVIELLSGNTVNGYYLMEGEQQGLVGRVRIVLKFYDDGRAEKTTYRAKSAYGQFTEKGKWLVNKKGKLCFIWSKENKKKCGRLLRTADGKYELLRKQQKFFYEEIVTGH